MSRDTHLAASHGGASDGHAGEEAHGTGRDLLIGFLASVLLTAIPFWLVMARPLGDGATALIVVGFAAVQVLVHMVYFLHMNGRSEGGWTLTALVFTVIVIVITISGSVWVMYNLNIHMMPVHTGTTGTP